VTGAGRGRVEGRSQFGVEKRPLEGDVFGQ
jgi:hypothetical protein